MTTSLIKGLSFAAAVSAVRDAAIARCEDGRVGFWTETGKEKVLVGIARKGHAAMTLEIDRAEWDGLKFLRLLDEPVGK